jgi:hypothetical protein
MSSHLDAITGSSFRKKIILFGAYGNGNLGDMVQAQSLRSSILDIFPDVGVWATSVMGEDFPYPDDFKLPRQFITGAEGTSLFDVLLIGGGGLLSHPHDPLGEDSWVASLKCSTFIYGVGSSDAFAPKALDLIRRASFVSGRDSESFENLGRYCTDVRFVPDPVLCDGRDRVDQPPIRSDDAPVCWILRGPKSAIHDEILSCIKDQDIIIGFEPAIDKDIAEVFPKIQWVESIESFKAIVEPCNRVISMRYHGVIFGLKLGLPSFNIGALKSSSLLKMFGTPECSGNNPRTLLETPAPNMKRTLEIIKWLEEYNKTNMRNALKGAGV